MANYADNDNVYFWDTDGTAQYFPTYAEFKAKLHEDLAEVTVFDNTDLVGNVLTVDHNLGRRPAGMSVYDSAGNKVGVAPNASTTQVIIDFKGAITGSNWELVIN